MPSVWNSFVCLIQYGFRMCIAVEIVTVFGLGDCGLFGVSLPPFFLQWRQAELEEGHTKVTGLQLSTYFSEIPPRLLNSRSVAKCPTSYHVQKYSKLSL